MIDEFEDFERKKSIADNIGYLSPEEALSVENFIKTIEQQRQIRSLVEESN